MKTKGVHICYGGPHRKITVGDRSYFFEMHHYFGPIPLLADGSVADRLFDRHHPFWRAFQLWDQQGLHVDEAGLCLWDDRID